MKNLISEIRRYQQLLELTEPKSGINEQKITMPDITSSSDSTMTKYDKPEPIVEPINLPDESNLQDGTKMKVSQQFWNYIKNSEGSSGKKGQPKKGDPYLQTYKDNVGVPTIGWGHTGDDVRMGMKISNARALELLYEDATENANCVRRFLSEWKEKGLKSYMITQGQFDALVSIVFNAGCEGVRLSNFIKFTKVGDHQTAAKEITNFKTLGLEGLKNRRNAEVEMYLNGNYNIS